MAEPRLERYHERLFPAVLTEYAEDDNGVIRYGWDELAVDEFGDYVALPDGRSGTVVMGWARELADHFVPVGTRVWLRHRDLAGGAEIHYEFDRCCNGEWSFGTYYPPAWTTTQNNYPVPPGVGIVYFSSTGTQTLTGASGVEGGRLVVWRNEGTSTVVVTDEDTSSTSTNRFRTPTGQPLTLAPGDQMTTVYDATLERHVVVSTTAPLLRPPQTETLTTSTDNLALDPGVPELVITNTTADLNLTGIKPPSSGSSLDLLLSSSPSSTFTTMLVTDSGSSDVDARFRTPTTTAPNVPLYPGTSILLRYDPALTAWVTKPTPPPPPYQPSWTGTVNNPVLPAGVTAIIPTLAAATTLTGFAAGAPIGTPITITNAAGSAYDLTLSNANGGSDVDFGFTSGADVVLSPGESLTVAYDGASVADVGGSLSLATPSTPGGEFPRWVKVTKTYADFSTAAATNTVNVYSLAAGGVIHATKVKHSASFTGGAISQYVVSSIGVSGSGSKYMVSPFNVFVAPSNTGGVVNYPSGQLAIESQAAPTNITMTVASTGANLNAATAGSLDLWLLVSVAT